MRQQRAEPAGLRDGLLVAARDLITARGWDSVRMADVAEAAGVSRRVVHDEFDGKASLAEALADREVGLLVDGVRAVLHRGGPEAALRVVAAATDGNPLLRAVLTGEDNLLPPVAPRAEIVAAWLAAELRQWAPEPTARTGTDPADLAALLSR